MLSLPCFGVTNKYIFNTILTSLICVKCKYCYANVCGDVCIKYVIQHVFVSSFSEEKKSRLYDVSYVQSISFKFDQTDLPASNVVESKYATYRIQFPNFESFYISNSIVNTGIIITLVKLKKN